MASTVHHARDHMAPRQHNLVMPTLNDPFRNNNNHHHQLRQQQQQQQQQARQQRYLEQQQLAQQQQQQQQQILRHQHQQRLNEQRQLQFQQDQKQQQQQQRSAQGPAHRHIRSQSAQQIPIRATQISPLSSNNSDNVSPTNNSSNLFMPAVLRPNQFPSRKEKRNGVKAPPPPTVAILGSPASSEESFGKERRSSILNFASYALPGLVRRATVDIRCSEDEWAMEDFPEVTDQPTRKHWKPDSSSQACDDPCCQAVFTYFTRRHHCRRCGNIFCDDHSRMMVPLDQNAEFNPRAPVSRACRHCVIEYESWKARNCLSPRKSSADESASPSANQASSESDTATDSTEQESVLDAPQEQPRQDDGFLKPTASCVDIAASVPRDWHWSTFKRTISPISGRYSINLLDKLSFAPH